MSKRTYTGDRSWMKDYKPRARTIETVDLSPYSEVPIGLLASRPELQPGAMIKDLAHIGRVANITRRSDGNYTVYVVYGGSIKRRTDWKPSKTAWVLTDRYNRIKLEE